MPSSYTLQKIKEFAIANSFIIDSPFKHFSFILHRNRIVCMGINYRKKTHPLAYRFKHRFFTIHSELSSITNFPTNLENLRRCTLVNVRVRKDSSIGMSKPCSYCQHMLDVFGLTDIIYTGNDGKFYSF